MNIRILPALLLAFVVVMQASGQTEIVAHKSHDGTVRSFEIDGEDNFGLPPKMLDSVFRISDTSAIEFSNFGIDTLHRHRHWNNPAIGLDSLRRLYPGVVFIGFEKKRKAEIIRYPERGAGYSGVQDAADSRTGWLALLCSLAFPVVAYSIWRSERSRKS